MNHSAERSLSTYLAGFVLAVVLTAIPFALVWADCSQAVPYISSSLLPRFCR